MTIGTKWRAGAWIRLAPALLMACTTARSALPTLPGESTDAGTVTDVRAVTDAGTGGTTGTDARPVDAPATPQCSTGQHQCPGGCVPDDSIQTCGTSCAPCVAPTGGTGTCDGKSCGGSCPSGKQLCLGACIDANAACSGVCPSGQHACGGLCPSLMDVTACGTSCLPCPVPNGASQATCDGTKCDFTCTTGYHKCGALCALVTDATACGASCMACPSDPNGAAQCVGGACALACNTGYHLCGNKCVSNLDTANCGTTSCAACAAPTGGSATCDGTACQPACPSGMKICSGTCIATAAACSGVCPSGTHNCSGICASNTSVNSCGSNCASCPQPTGASATTCSGTACDFTCGTGTHRCGTGTAARCASDTDATGCGTSCVSCPTDANGTAACVNGTCALMCASGFHQCGGKCVDNKAVATCGPVDNSSCTPCTAPTGGTVTCDGLSCHPACSSGAQLCAGACIPSANACNGVCPSGQHACAGICQANTSTTACGPSCVQCTTPQANGSATCNATTGACGITCASGFKNCPGTTLCIPSSGCCANTDCTALPANTTAVCGSANTCSYPCASGFQLCGTSCISTATCCLSQCPTASGGTAVCAGSACDITCNSGNFTCAGSPKTCGARVVNFDSGTVQGFAIDTAESPSNSVVSNRAAPVARAGGSQTSSLAYSVSLPAPNGLFRTGAIQTLCSIGSTNLLGATLSVWVYIQTSSPIATGSDASIYLWTQGGGYYPFPGVSNPPANTWFQISGVATNSIAASSNAIELEFYDFPASTFTGTIYFDDFNIGP